MYATSAAALPARRRSRRMSPGQRLLIALVTALVLLGGAVLSVAAKAERSPVPLTVTVQAGDTLWEIAERHGKGRDPRAMVYAIRQANGLPSADIHPGQVLVIPKGGR